MHIHLDLRNHLITRLNHLQTHVGELAHQLEHATTEIHEIAKVIASIPAKMSEEQIEQIAATMLKDNDLVFSTEFNRGSALGFVTSHVEDGFKVHTFESVHQSITPETLPVYERLIQLSGAEVQKVIDENNATTVWVYVKPKASVDTTAATNEAIALATDTDVNTTTAE
jgi:hypothetical protein